MKFFVASDLHGNIEFYEEALQLAVQIKAKVVLLAGDLLPEGYTLDLSLDTQREFIYEVLKYYLEQFKKADINVILILGNQDWAYCENGIKDLEQKELCIYAHRKLINIPQTEYQLVGYNCVPNSEFYKKDWERLEHRGIVIKDSEEFYSATSENVLKRITSHRWFASKPTIEEELISLPRPLNWRKTILLSHIPPKQTPLDRHYSGACLGSSSMRNFILSRKPYLTVHGHIHESPRISGIFICPMDTTWSINPGQQLGNQRFHCCWFDIENVQETIKHNVFGASRKLSDIELIETGAIPRISGD